MSSWKKGSLQEKRIKRLIEQGDYDGQEYSCVISPKAKYYRQDFWGHDIVCVNDTNWLLCQVKYESKRLPAKKKKLINAMLETPMPDSTKRVLARVDGRDQSIRWDEL